MLRSLLLSVVVAGLLAAPASTASSVEPTETPRAHVLVHVDFDPAGGECTGGPDSQIWGEDEFDLEPGVGVSLDLSADDVVTSPSDPTDTVAVSATASNEVARFRWSGAEIYRLSHRLVASAVPARSGSACQGRALAFSDVDVTLSTAAVGWLLVAARTTGGLSDLRVGNTHGETTWHSDFADSSTARVWLPADSHVVRSSHSVTADADVPDRQDRDVTSDIELEIAPPGYAVASPPSPVRRAVALPRATDCAHGRLDLTLGRGAASADRLRVTLDGRAVALPRHLEPGRRVRLRGLAPTATAVVRVKVTEDGRTTTDRETYLPCAPPGTPIGKVSTVS